LAQDMELLESSVGDALSGRHCVSAWLGYGNVLFLGFGPDLIPLRTPEGRHTIPPYELQTSIAEWCLRGDTTADLEDEAEFAEEAVSALIGLSVVRWQLTPALGLRIEFTGSRLLEITPPSEIDAEDKDLDWWWLCLPDFQFVGVGGNGHVISGRTDGPARRQSAEPKFARD
jgi:hypothetical protein